MSGTDAGAHEGILERPGEPDLFWRLHPAADGKPKALLFFVHGLAEHFGRYGFPVDYFTARGYACAGLDLRGHGRSTGLRAHVDRFDGYLDDVDAARRHVAALLAEQGHEDLPTILVGHSMGGVVATLYAHKYGADLQGLVLSSPGFAAHPDSAPSFFIELLGKIASKLLPKLLFPTDLDPTFVCRDPAVVEAYRQDPLVTSKVSARWFTEFLAAQARSFQAAETEGAFSMPILAMQSEADRLVDPAATARFAALVGPEGCRFNGWPGLFHEMFNEPERNDVFQFLETWLDDVLP